MKLILKYLKNYKLLFFFNVISVFGFILVELGIPTIVATMIDVGVTNKDVSFIYMMGGCIALVSLIGVGGTIALGYCCSKISTAITRDIRNDIFAKVQQFTANEFNQIGTSSMITRTNNDAFQIQQFVNVLLRTALMTPIMFIFSFIMTARASLPLSYIIAATIPLIILGVVVVAKITKPISENQQSSLDDLNRISRENLSGIRVIRAFNNDQYEQKRKSAYREKEALMLERGYPEVSPHDFYRELFPTGSLQQEPGDGKGNIIATQIRPSGKGRTRQWVIDDSLKMLDKVIGDRFGLIPPISFYGKSHTKENAHELFAVVVDVDYVGKQQLKNLLKQFGNGVQLRPTYLVSSGKGVHLYYFLQDALRALKGDRKRLSTIASREWIEDNTKVTIPANKRNYRKQEAHLYLARRKKEDMKVIGEVVKEGRPTAERTVREWQESHPAGKKADCIRETGLAKHTVYKWWK